MIIKLAGNTSIHNLKEFLAGRQIEAPQEVIQALDIVLRESPSTKYFCFLLFLYNFLKYYIIVNIIFVATCSASGILR